MPVERRGFPHHSQDSCELYLFLELPCSPKQNRSANVICPFLPHFPSRARISTILLTKGPRPVRRMRRRRGTVANMNTRLAMCKSKSRPMRFELTHALSRRANHLNRLRPARQRRPTGGRLRGSPSGREFVSPLVSVDTVNLGQACPRPPAFQDSRPTPPGLARHLHPYQPLFVSILKSP